MKRFSIIVLSFVFITACGSMDQGEENPEDSSTQDSIHREDSENGESSATTESNEQDDMKSKMDALDFREIEVEVSYGKDKEYEVEIEQDDNRPIEAEVEDELNNVFMKGMEAFNDIYAKAEKLSLTSDSPEQEVIDQVLAAFELPEDYTKFEVEIKFHDGTELDMEQRK